MKQNTSLYCNIGKVLSLILIIYSIITNRYLAMSLGYRTNFTPEEETIELIIYLIASLLFILLFILFRLCVSNFNLIKIKFYLTILISVIVFECFVNVLDSFVFEMNVIIQTLFDIILVTRSVLFVLLGWELLQIKASYGSLFKILGSVYIVFRLFNCFNLALNDYFLLLFRNNWEEWFNNTLYLKWEMVKGFFYLIFSILELSCFYLIFTRIPRMIEEGNKDQVPVALARDYILKIMRFYLIFIVLVVVKEGLYLFILPEESKFDIIWGIITTLVYTSILYNFREYLEAVKFKLISKSLYAIILVEIISSISLFYIGIFQTKEYTLILLAFVIIVLIILGFYYYFKVGGVLMNTMTNRANSFKTIGYCFILIPLVMIASLIFIIFLYINQIDIRLKYIGLMNTMTYIVLTTSIYLFLQKRIDK